jgi:hypothetical protein
VEAGGGRRPDRGNDTGQHKESSVFITASIRVAGLANWGPHSSLIAGARVLPIRAAADSDSGF